MKLHSGKKSHVTMDAGDRVKESLGFKDLKAEQRKVIDVFMCGRDMFICLWQEGMLHCV